MSTLTEKYKSVVEGTLSKEQFLRDARLSHPNLITQFNSYEDTVNILKNKGLIFQEISMRNEDPFDPYEDDFNDLDSFYDDYIDDPFDDEDYIEDYSGDEYEWEEDIEDVEDEYMNKYLQENKRLLKENRQAEKTNQYEIHKDTVPEDHIPPDRLDKAIRYELEKAGLDYIANPPSMEEYEAARKKAIAGLQRDPLYYLELEQPRKRTDQMQNVTKSNMIDKDNAMTKATLREVAEKRKRARKIVKESFKKLIVKILNS